MPLDAVFAAPASVLVTVVDSATGQSLVPGARGRWIVGTKTDSLHDWGNALAAIGPTGRYTVVLEAPGYRAWARDDLRVRRGECGPVLEKVSARLRREQAGLAVTSKSKGPHTESTEFSRAANVLRRTSSFVGRMKPEHTANLHSVDSVTV